MFIEVVEQIVKYIFSLSGFKGSYLGMGMLNLVSYQQYIVFDCSEFLDGFIQILEDDGKCIEVCVEFLILLQFLIDDFCS